MRRHPHCLSLLALSASLTLCTAISAIPVHADSASSEKPADGASEKPAEKTPDSAKESPPSPGQGTLIAQNEVPGAATEPPEGTKAPSATTPANVPPSQSSNPNKISVTGVADFYYLYQFSSPRQNNRLGGRIYDFRHNAPTLALVWLDIVKPTPAGGGFGFTISPAVGDSVDADHADAASGKGEARWKNLQQIYGTYATKSGITFDFGKYLSPYGYDTTKVILNYNYSLNFPTFLVPNYVAGLKMQYPLKNVGKGSFLGLWVINSIYHTTTSGIQEDNGRPDIILRAGYTTSNEKFSYIPAVGFGKDRLGNPGAAIKGNEKVLLWDNWLTYKITPVGTLAGEYVYRKDRDDGGLYDLKANGYAVYYRHQLNPKDAAVLRWSGFSNKTTNFAPGLAGSSKFNVWEVTGTYERKFTKALTGRLEYRHDHSSDPAQFGFVDGDSSTLSSKQDTLAAALLFTF